MPKKRKTEVEPFFTAESVREFLQSRYRRDPDLTWSAFCEKHGFDERTLRHIVNGYTKKVTLRTADRLCCALDSPEALHTELVMV